MTQSATPIRKARPNTEMNIIGYVVGIGAVLLLLPALPFVALLWIVDRLTGGRLSDRYADRGIRQSRENVEPSAPDR